MTPVPVSHHLDRIVGRVVNDPGDARPPPRLDSLDGLRALAALYVVLFHAGVGLIPGTLPSWTRALNRLLAFGHEAVAIFIVVSGYCLMLPVLRAGGRMPRGIPNYFARRAWRILPPYYATLALSLALIALVPALQTTETGTIWDDTNPAFERGAVVSHLLVVHNLFPRWTYRINGPLWSVATEWQIYFFLPFVLLPVWRRAGVAATIAVGFAIGLLPLALWPPAATSAVSWYLGLFALGMGAAAVSRSPRSLEQRLRNVVPWGWVAFVLSGLCAVGGLVLAKHWFSNKPITDTLVGLTTATFLIHCAALLSDNAPVAPWHPLRLLRVPALVKLGHFSYSLYLTHLPVLALCLLLLRTLQVDPVQHLILMLALGTAASIAVAYAFFRLVESKFLGGPPPRLGRLTANR